MFQVETLPATHIRGKCTVTLLNETESLLSYLNKDVSAVTIYHLSIFRRLNFAARWHKHLGVIL